MMRSMVELKDVHGSKEASAELIIGYDTVYVHSNIRKCEDKGRMFSKTCTCMMRFSTLKTNTLR